MARILVTGGNGFLGQQLIKQLLQEKEAHQIIALGRTRPEKYYIDIEKMPRVTVHYGMDLSNYSLVLEMFQNVDLVFHLAGLVSFKKRDQKKLMQTNVQGTKNVLMACREKGVKKLIHVSSTAALGYSKKREVITEEFNFKWKKKARRNKYSFSKHLAERAVLADSNKHLTKIIVNPALILGPGDRKLAPKLVNALAKRQIPFNPPGKNSLVDVRDVAKALVFLMSKGENEEKYLLAPTSLTFRRMNWYISRELSLPAPKATLPTSSYPLLNTVAFLYEALSKKPKLTQENVFFSFKRREHSSQKIRDLGFSFSYTAEQTIQDTVSYLREEQLVKRS